MRLLTVKETARICRVTIYTVYRWIACGTLPASKPKGSWLIREDDLEAFLARPPAGMAMEDYVRLIVDGAPTLTEDQLARLRDALGRNNA